MKAITKKQQTILDPKWLRQTAALAMTRGTAIIFSKTRVVYGIVPKSGGSVNVFYKGDDDWIDAVLSRFPEGAIFPAGATFGGPGTARELRPYASIRLPEDGGKAWIDDVTSVLHVKGVGAVVKSSTFDACDIPVAPPPQKIPDLVYDDCVTPDVGALLVDVTRRDDNRPALKRVMAIEMDGGRRIAATDGKSGMAVRCENVPGDFSFDPALIPLFDIVGYRSDTDAVTGATVRHYRVSDGTTLSERLSILEMPNIGQVMSRTMAASKRTLLTGTAAQKLVESITELGVCAQDKTNSIIKLSARNTEVLIDGQAAAEFEIRSDLGPDDVVYFFLPVLTKMARLGGTVTLCDSGSPAVVENGSAVMVAMPAKLA